MAQQDQQQHLGNAGTQFPSPVWHSGLRILHCYSCSLGLDCGLDLIPDPGAPYASGWPKKGKRKKKKKMESLMSVGILELQEPGGSTKATEQE